MVLCIYIYVFIYIYVGFLSWGYKVTGGSLIGSIRVLYRV